MLMFSKAKADGNTINFIGFGQIYMRTAHTVLWQM